MFKAAKSKRIVAGLYVVSTEYGTFEVNQVVYPHDGSVWWNLILPDGSCGDAFTTKREALEATTEILDDPARYGLSE